MSNLYPNIPESSPLDMLSPSLRPNHKKVQSSAMRLDTNPFHKWLSTSRESSSTLVRNQPTPRFEYRQVSAKEIIFYKGDPANQLFMLISGKVKVSAPSEDGKEIIFGIFGPGELIGEMGVLEEADHTATVTALEPTELAVLERREFFLLLEQTPAIAIRLLTILCERLRRTSEIAEDISFLPLPVRLAKKIYSLAQTYGKKTPKGTRIEIHLYQQELANMVGTSRESINKQLANWQQEGIASMDRGYMVIHKFGHLLDLAGCQTEGNDQTPL